MRIIAAFMVAFAFFLMAPTCKKTPEYYYSYGKHYESDGDYVQAFRYYSKAIEKNSSYIDAYLARASVCFLQDSFLMAIGDYTKVIDLRPERNNSDIYYLRGNVYWGSLRDTLACNDFRKSCDLGYNRACDAWRKHCKK